MFLNNFPDLFHLISLGLGALSLEIDFLLHTMPAKNVVATAYSDFKSQVFQQMAEVIELNIGI